MNTVIRIPIVCLDRSALSAFSTFNPNDWEGASRGVVQSCATEFGVLEYSARRIEVLCATAGVLCSRHFETLESQWRTSPWDLTRVSHLAQVPELHVLIEGFFAGLKSLLDINIQLLSTERIVGVSLDGFHRDKGVYGGAVINALDNNVTKGKEPIAAAIRTLLFDHKERWIDQAIQARDFLVHPVRGAQQLMFEIQLESHNGSLVYHGVVPPHVDGIPISKYAAARIESVRELSTALLEKLRQSS